MACDEGDHNGCVDSVYITRQNYQARVFGIIYAREPARAGPGLAQGLAAR